MRKFLLILPILLLVMAFATGCPINNNPPSTQPVVLTPQQQQEITVAQGLQQDADLANDAVQFAVLADPGLAGDAAISATADKALDLAVAQYISDVEAGGVAPQTLLDQIKAGLAQVLNINGAHPAAAARYVKAKAAKTQAMVGRR